MYLRNTDQNDRLEGTESIFILIKYGKLQALSAQYYALQGSLIFFWSIYNTKTKEQRMFCLRRELRKCLDMLLLRKRSLYLDLPLSFSLYNIFKATGFSNRCVFSLCLLHYQKIKEQRKYEKKYWPLLSRKLQITLELNLIYFSYLIKTNIKNEILPEELQFAITSSC